MQFLSNEQLERMAPAVATRNAHESRSDRYGFLNTLDVVDALRGAGWFPVNAQIGKPRTLRGSMYGKHLVRFRQAEVVARVGEVVPEVICYNAHDGTSAYRFMAGLYRFVCANGLVVSDGTFGSIHVNHTRRAIEQALEASQEILAAVPQIIGNVEAWKLVPMAGDWRAEFAEQAASLRPGVLRPIAAQLLRPRRYADSATDLWTTFNVVQENIIRGGTVGEKVVEFNGSKYTERQRLRAIASPKELVSINRGLWDLAEQYAEAA